MELKRLDWKNPQGARTFAFFKELCEAQRNILEPYKGSNPKSNSPPLPKSRTVFNVNQCQPTPPPFREICLHILLGTLRLRIGFLQVRHILAP